MSHRHTVPRSRSMYSMCTDVSLSTYIIYYISYNVTTCGIPVEVDGTISHEINSIQEKPGLSCYDVQERG